MKEERTSLEDRAEIVQLKQQDHQAFSRLVQRHHAALVTLAASIAGETWGEEVVQEAWVAIYHALPGFEERSSLLTWMLTIVKNQARSRFRKEKRVIPSEQGFQNEDSGSWLDTSFEQSGRWARPPVRWTIDSPEALLQEEQLLHCIEHTLGLLKGEQKAVFFLRDMEQLSLEQICNILELSNSNVRVLLHRARLKLLRVIERYQETGEC